MGKKYIIKRLQTSVFCGSCHRRAKFLRYRLSLGRQPNGPGQYIFGTVESKVRINQRFGLKTKQDPQIIIIWLCVCVGCDSMKLFSL
jgi:hypothetical protein